MLIDNDQNWRMQSLRALSYKTYFECSF